MKSTDIVAIGTCYVDTNLPNYPFSRNGITAGSELVGDQYEIAAGGSAVNFCRLLGSFGLKTAFIGIAGHDPNGHSLELALQHDGIEPLLIKEDGLLTNISFNMTNADGEHIMLVAGTANAALGPDAVLPQLDRVISNVGMLYMGGCFKLKGLAPAFADVINIANRYDTQVVVDHGRIPDGASAEMSEAVRHLVRGSKYYLPSRDEFCQLWQADGIEAGLEKLHLEAPKLTVIVKDGANGAYYWDNGTVHHAPAIKVEKVIHATGAGDSFNAGVIAALNHGLSVAEATAYACRVGAAKVSGHPMPML